MLGEVYSCQKVLIKSVKGTGTATAKSIRTAVELRLQDDVVQFKVNLTLMVLISLSKR